MTPGPTNNAGHRQLATVGKTLEPRLPEAGHHAEVYISQVGTVTGYCGLSPVLFPAGAPLIPSLVHVGQGRKWVVSTAPVGGCTDGLCLWGLHGLCWHVLFTEEEPGGYLHSTFTCPSEATSSASGCDLFALPALPFSVGRHFYSIALLIQEV